MRWTSRFTTENIFLLSGIGIILLGWVSDYIGISLGESPGGHGAGDIISRLFFTLFGLFFASGGAVYEQHWRFLNDSLFTKRYLAGYLFILDGALHLFAMTDHLTGGEPLWEAVFFAIVASGQIVIGSVFPRLPQKYDVYWFITPILLIAAWAVARMVVIWPLTDLDTTGALDIISKLVEGLILLVLYSVIQEERAKERKAKAGAPSPGT